LGNQHVPRSWSPQTSMLVSHRHDKEADNRARQGKARQGKARQGKARQGKSR